MATKFITVIDVSSEPYEGYHRQTSLSMRNSEPEVLGVVGVIPHGSTITFDRESAEKMIKFCQSILDK